MWCVWGEKVKMCGSNNGVYIRACVVCTILGNVRPNNLYKWSYSLTACWLRKKICSKDSMRELLWCMDMGGTSPICSPDTRYVRGMPQYAPDMCIRVVPIIEEKLGAGLGSICNFQNLKTLIFKTHSSEQDFLSLSRVLTRAADWLCPGVTGEDIDGDGQEPAKNWTLAKNSNWTEQSEGFCVDALFVEGIGRPIHYYFTDFKKCELLMT